MTEGMIDLERVARRIAATRVPHNYTEAAFVEEYWRSFLPPARAVALDVIAQLAAVAPPGAGAALLLFQAKSELERDRL